MKRDYYGIFKIIGIIWFWSIIFTIMFTSCIAVSIVTYKWLLTQ